MMQATTSIKEILDDLQVVLSREPEALKHHYANEMPPLELEVVLHRKKEEKDVGTPTFSPSLSTIPKEQKKSIEPVVQKNLAKNFRCTLCSDRMYAVSKYYVKGTSGVLVLHHTGSFLDGKFRRDQSNKSIMGGAEEDDLFKRMINATGHQVGELHFQEYLACHFNPERSLDEDWNDRGQKCLNHVMDTIRENNIQKLILTGPAAVLLLGQEKAAGLAKSSEKIPLALGPEQSQIPALVIRSPLALLAIEKKRKDAQLAQDLDRYEKYKGLEKSIKATIVKSLQLFLT